MGKKNSAFNKLHPLVSVCTPTFNRRPFFSTLFQCFRNQTYPKHRVEWIIVDDGTDKISDLVTQSEITQIKYIPVEQKMTLGAKRNLMHIHATGSIIVYMDDDDYYPPERISHAVETLMSNPHALCAGSSELYLYFKHIGKMFQFGPYGPNHSTAGTFAFKRELLKITKYNDNSSLAEEREFLKEYTIPFVQLDPMKTILVFSHIHNSFDKRKLLETQPPQFMKESSKNVHDFIRLYSEEPIHDFFMKHIDELLEAYSPGLPIMKPDVLKQMMELDKEREQMMANQPMQLMVQEPDKEPRPIQYHEAIKVVIQQGEQLKNSQTRIKELEQQCSQLLEKNVKLEKRILEISESAKTVLGDQNSTTLHTNNTHPHVFKLKNKSQPEVTVKI